MGSCYKRVEIGEDVLYIKGLDVVSNDAYVNDSIFDKAKVSNSLEDALKSVLSLTKVVKNQLEELGSDEVEMTIQLGAGIDGNNLFFGFVDVNMDAQITVKSIWKKKDNNKV